MGAAEGKAVVEQDAAIGDIDALHVDGESLAELLPEREVEGGVRLQMAWGRTAVGKTRSVIDVRRGVGMEWQIVTRAEMQGVALVMIEKTETVTKGKVSEASIDISKREGELV